jgi:PleD family two-component response regulator
VFVAALAVVTVTRRASAGASQPILVPGLVTLGAVALAALLVRLVLRDIAWPFHSAGVNIRSNVDQLSAVVQRLAATTAEQSGEVAQTSATMEELARAVAAGRGRAPGRPAAAAARRRRPDRMAGPVTPPPVLVAEDSLVIRAVLVEQLQSRGYRVIEAGDGEQARVHAAVRNKALQDELRLRTAELELASRTDALTGLRNRRHLEEQLQRLAIAAAPVPLADGPLTVTTSVGVASGADDGWECLARRADTGLYAAKEADATRWSRARPRAAAGSRTFTPEGQDAARYR